MKQRWEVTVVDEASGKVHTTVEEVSPPMAQASAEVAAIKRHDGWQRGRIRCASSRFVGSVS